MTLKGFTVALGFFLYGAFSFCSVLLGNLECGRVLLAKQGLTPLSARVNRLALMS